MQLALAEGRFHDAERLQQPLPSAPRATRSRPSAHSPGEGGRAHGQIDGQIDGQICGGGAGGGALEDRVAAFVASGGLEGGGATRRGGEHYPPLHTIDQNTPINLTINSSSRCQMATI